ncbi:MAG: L,D-transpeptidase family protein [Lentisphaeria bacterium]|nr:L,D-transpeptidase family protein [Lentisphaeria bacterium]NQZ69533.1 L,D-transpeptidase family protein [Lentisphaeria bacterium]
MKKKKRRIILCGILLIFISIISLQRFGRSIWYPAYVKIAGEKTSEEIYTNNASEVEPIWQKRLNKIGRENLPKQISIIALKHEQILEIWTNDTADNKLITKFNFTAFSGTLGPKLKEGDLQIPEGIYKLEYLNPNSSYHLSMKINYPNKADIQNAKSDRRTNIGSDIFIHGKSVTIGCIPIGDKHIEELYNLVYEIGLKNVDVIIAPNDLRIKKPLYENEKLKWLKNKYKKIEHEMNNYKI